MQVKLRQIVINFLLAYSANTLSQESITSWGVLKTIDGATLYSTTDGEAPYGLDISITCTKGSAKVGIRTYLSSQAGAYEKPEVFQRGGAFVIGCDPTCKAANRHAYSKSNGYSSDEANDLQPKQMYKVTSQWKTIRKKVTERVKSKNSLGGVNDRKEMELLEPCSSNLKIFLSACNLLSDSSD